MNSSRDTARGLLLCAIALPLTLVISLIPDIGLETAGARNPGVACAPDSIAAPSPSLYCIDLVPVPDYPDAAGIAELRHVPGPFGAALSRDGAQLYDVVLDLGNLPPPAALGPYATYVAWATTPMLDPMVRLGEVRDGRAMVGRVDLDKFIIMVSAEASADVAVRRGRLILRGTSPSMMMQPHAAANLPAMPAARHAHHDDGAGWPMPPMHRAVPGMIPGLESLRPAAAPFLPGAGIDVAALPEAAPRRLVTLRDGDSLALDAMLVRRTIGGRTFAMYGFNGQHPGPLIDVRERATVVVNFTNRIELPTAVHWHGIRLDNRFDGVPHVTQDLVPPGGSFRYVIHFPDPGIYWYHPHHREDIQQDMGLYGNIMVRSASGDYWAPVNREEVLMLDDLLVGDRGPIPYGREQATHALMGRFGNVFLVNGQPRWRLAVRRGDVVRFYLTNVANTRPFNVSFGELPLKVVASDVGKYEREVWAQSVVIAPAERYVVEARFDAPGAVALVNRVRAIDHAQGLFFSDIDTLGIVTVSSDETERDHTSSFRQQRRNADVIADIDRYRHHFARPPDHELFLTLRTRDIPFGLLQVLRLDTGYVNPVEWSGTMPMMDWLSTGREVEWVLRDVRTGRENMDVAWTFRRGDVVKLRLTNDRHTLHPMQHPIHIHGQRFLVLAQNGVPNDNLVWKDTMLLPVGATADVLLELSNPGRWMLHCHIAEHLEAGMHMVFSVDNDRGSGPGPGPGSGSGPGSGPDPTSRPPRP
ncbi:MAG: multicopper oxidase family protein [Gemmatimonadota bacterium]|nr:multicopper oxidase family protein [Gemmatimonadota bacterium]